MQTTGKAVALGVRALARFLPIDPGYAPFGLKGLRGFNVMPLALVGVVALAWNLSYVVPTLALGGELAWQRDLFSSAQAVVCFTPMLALVIAAENASAGWPARSRLSWLAAATLLGALLMAATWQVFGCLWQPARFAGEAACALLTPTWNKGSTFVRGAIWGTLFTALLCTYKRDLATQRELHTAQLRRLGAERQETEARLRSLQAQIEPHFLFNTLAHIQRLVQVQPERGRAMLRDLIDYLRSALPQMRQPTSTLGRELAMTRAYLNVQRIRMGERLRVELDVPEPLTNASLPPMMLVTLVENAIKHGVGPKREGGTVRIGARAAGGRLRVEVVDDGVGLKLGAGAGRGLANTRARLATQFGADGALEIGSSAGGGVCAALLVPYRPAA
jgi:LytS/YehU family sensor histidine kinase